MFFEAERIKFSGMQESMFSALEGDTSDTVSVVNRGRWRFLEASDAKLRNYLKPA